MQLSFTEKNIRKNFGKLRKFCNTKSNRSSKNSYKELTEFKNDVDQHLIKGLEFLKVFSYRRLK